MASEQDRTIQAQIRTLFNDGVTAGLTDGQLLERYTSRRDEAAELAFAALVERHGPMVLSRAERSSGMTMKLRMPSRPPSWCWRSKAARSGSRTPRPVAPSRGVPHRAPCPTHLADRREMIERRADKGAADVHSVETQDRSGTSPPRRDRPAPGPLPRAGRAL